MKKIYTLMAFASVVLTANAQTTVNDSIETGASYANDVFYSLKTGQVKSQPNNDWHIALSIGSLNATIRANTAVGSSTMGAISLYETPDKDTTKWSTINDTAGLGKLSPLNNSLESWDEGAFNVNAGAFPDYGWGVYSGPPKHMVVGNRIYIVKINATPNNIYKKLWIVNKDLGNWTVRYADIDGSNEKTVEIKSADYAGKNFAYLSFTSDQVVDREPASTAWDFVYTRYNSEVAPGAWMPVTGILTNYGVATAEIRGMVTDDVKLKDSGSFSDNISIIGSDWKRFNNATFTYEMIDSLSYIVSNQEGDYYKIVFTGFRSATGFTKFSKTELIDSSTSVKGAANVAAFGVYPNPAVDNIELLLDTRNFSGNVEYSVLDMSGRTQIAGTANVVNGLNAFSMPVAALTSGVYVMQVKVGSDIVTSKFIKQ